jgi:hypothetical protein
VLNGGTPVTPIQKYGLQIVENTSQPLETKITGLIRRSATPQNVAAPGHRQSVTNHFHKAFMGVL